VRYALVPVLGVLVGCVQTVSVGSDFTDSAVAFDARPLDAVTDVVVLQDVRDVPPLDRGPSVDRVDAAVVEAGPVPMGQVSSIVAGARHTCGRRSDGSCWCWGDNRHGQLGDGTTETRTTPVLVAGLTDVRALALGAEHTCALAGTPSRIWCWGRSEAGRLFVDRTTDVLQPLDTGLSATAIAAGGATTCALDGAGRVRCAGPNDEGQRGAAPGTDLALPQAATALVLGSAFGCALLEDGRVWCWGRNVEGQTGRGTTTPTATPGSVVGPLAMATVRALTAGARHVCAQTSDEAWCWGDRAQGQLGDGILGGVVSTPARIAWDARVLVAGAEFTCGISSQSVHCAGANDRFQLGMPGPARATPGTPVVGFERVGALFLTAGAAHACAYLSDARVWCWGDGSLGQRGDGSREPIEMPRTINW